MNRLIALVIVGVMSMVLSGCGQSTAPKPTEMKVEEKAAPAMEHEAGSPAAEKPAGDAAEAAPAAQE